jgi:hypothetical protein
MASNSELVALADGEVAGEAAICKFVRVKISYKILEAEIAKFTNLKGHKFN